jgi:Secretion system C-terminal sorting domain
MRKIILGLIAIISNLSFGQVTLEHSYNTSSQGFGERYSFAFNTESGLNHFTYEQSTKTFKIYNESHSLTNTFVAQIPSNYEIYSDGFSFYGVLATDKLFNTNNSIEFLIALVNTTTWEYKFILMDDSGVILQEFNDRSKFGGIYKTSTGNYKFILKKVTANSSIVDVYSLPGTLSVNQQQLLGNNFKSYPNPTENVINISNNLSNGENSTLEIFNINGQKVMQETVSGNQGEINLDVTDLNEGVYIYKLNGQSNRFVKK